MTQYIAAALAAFVKDDYREYKTHVYDSALAFADGRMSVYYNISVHDFDDFELLPLF